MSKYRATSTDCLSSIAGEYGFYWETIWSASENTELRQSRPNPNVLAEGDIVFIPELTKGEESAATECKHSFRKKDQTLLILRLLRGESPVASAGYELEIDGKVSIGNTDGDGLLEHVIPATAIRGVLKLDDSEDELTLEFGALDPVEEISGIQGRLDNLGFDCLLTNELNAETRTALQLFQEMYEITVTGEPDDATKDKLKEVYGC